MSDAWSEAMKYTRKQTGNSWNDDIFTKQTTYKREEKMTAKKYRSDVAQVGANKVATAKPLALNLEKEETKLLIKCVGAYLKDLDTYGEHVGGTIGQERLNEHKEFVDNIKTKLKHFLRHVD